MKRVKNAVDMVQLTPAIDNDTPIIANMCNKCKRQYKNAFEIDCCTLHMHPHLLPCVKNNEECPDYI